MLQATLKNSQLTSQMEFDNKNTALYTPEQVETIAAEAVKIALQQVSPTHLDSSIPQLSPAITVAEAAQIMRISKPSMYELVRSHQVHFIRIGKKILISRQSLLDLIEGRKQ